MDFESQVQSQSHRYKIESSDSSGDESLARPSRPTAPPSVSVSFHSTNSKTVISGKSLIAAVGPEGRLWTRGLRDAASIGSATLDGVQVAEALSLGGAVVLLIHLVNPPLAALHPLAEALLDALQPSSLHVVDAYSVESYLTDDATQSDPPVRFLQSQHAITPEPALALLDVPNLASGIGAALVTEAVQRDIPCSVAFLPSSAAGAFSVSTRRRPEGVYDPALEDDEGQDVTIYALQRLSAQAVKALGWTDWDRTSLRSVQQSDQLWKWAAAADLVRRKEAARRFTNEGSALYI